MSLLERRSDDAGNPAAVAGRIGENAVVASDASHRIRLGLTGLAAIFLVGMIAAVGLRPTATQAAPEAQAEPLAVLGVAPGAGPAAVDETKAPAAGRRPSQT